MRHALWLLVFATPAFGQWQNVGTTAGQLAPPAQHATIEDACRHLADVAARRGHAIQCEIQQHGQVFDYIAYPDGRVMVKGIKAQVTAPRPEVRAPRHPTVPSGTTGTTVPNADMSPHLGPAPGSYGAATPTAYTYMPALNVVRSGNMTGNGCPPGG